MRPSQVEAPELNNLNTDLLAQEPLLEKYWKEMMIRVWQGLYSFDEILYRRITRLHQSRPLNSDPAEAKLSPRVLARELMNKTDHQISRGNKREFL